jgi:chemotaxis protein MotB
MSEDQHKKQSILDIGGHKKSGGHDEGGEGSWLVSYADMMTLLVGFFVILLSFANVDQEKFDAAREAITKQFGGVYEMPYDDVTQRIKEALTKMGIGDQFIIKQSSNGVEISFLGTVFFETGSADLKEQSQQLLAQLIPVIKAEPTKFNVLVEGHTDDVPIIGGILFKNNWELSSVRACRVLNYFSESGFEKTTLTAVGFGETKPIAPNRDENGVPILKNMSQNRRVIIKLLRQAQQSL